MVFTAQQMPKPLERQRVKKAEYPFDRMKANPGTGFTIPSDRSDLFQHCRVLASMYNKINGTLIKCNKQIDGSLRVWNEKTEPNVIVIEATDTAQLLEASVKIAEQRNEQKQTAKESQPTKQQFIEWIDNSLQPGMSYTFQYEYAHRFDEFKEWVSDIEGCETEVKFNPPSLKISRKGKE